MVLSTQQPPGVKRLSDPIKIALKLTATALKKQQEDINFIAGLIRATQDIHIDLVIHTSPLIPESQRPSSYEQPIAAETELGPDFELPNFDAWYEVEVEGLLGSSAVPTASGDAAEDLALPGETLELIHKLHDLPEVESAHALQAGPPPTVDPDRNPRSQNQGYLNPAPAGIDARYAWSFRGGDGAGVNIVDMEQGWNLNHEDLREANITLISGRNAAYFDHGTAVLGQMLMVDNTIGGVGIVPSAKGRVISQHRDNGTYNTPATILDAVNHMAYGDILLLEAQEFDPVNGTYYWPVSIVDSNFDAIRLATARGITVVEAACNGGQDLDRYVSLSGKRIFNRATGDYRESGAIMVGAASSEAPHVRLGFSNYGSRVDAYAWGENIDTSFTDSTGTLSTYTTTFSGTSGASPIVVGVVAAIQGIANALYGHKFPPLQLRKIITTGGTESDLHTDRIGVMPNLQVIIDSYFPKLVPDPETIEPVAMNNISHNLQGISLRA